MTNPIFPKTRYQGSKYKLREWIKEELNKLEFNSCLDAFSGTSSIAYLLKDMGKIVYTNDVLNFNYYIAKALIENNNEKITQEEINTILIKKEDFIYDNFIERTFEDIYFLTEENKWLDIVIQNIYEIENEYKKAMFLWAIYQATLSKRPYNLFHRKNLNLRTSEVKRNFGNKTTWDKPFEEHFKKFINEINNAIFNNNQNNKAFNLDVFDLDIKVDLVYIDPPYIPQKGSLTYYRDFYHFLEGITDYNNWFQNIDYKSKNKKLLSKYNIWEDKVNINKAFKDLIYKFKDSKIMISYREDGTPSIEETSKILKDIGKVVEIKTMDYKYALSKKQNIKEVLIIAT